jgi:predicted anti-sigma-YlaC factor YlaD
LSVHLTKTQIEDYWRQSLAVVDLLSVTDHLGLCDACRLQAQRALNGDDAYLALRSDLFNQTQLFVLPKGREHLTFEQIAGIVDATLAAEELQVADDHLSCCQQCLLAVADLSAFKDQGEFAHQNQISSPLSSRKSAGESRWSRLFQLWPKRLVLSSALAALLLAASSWMVWQARTGMNQGPVTTNVTPSMPATPVLAPAAATIALLNDGAGQVKLDGHGKLSGVAELPQAYQQMVRRVLTDQEIERSPRLAELAPEGIMRGVGRELGPRFSLIEPVRTVTLSEQPTFRWARLTGATEYVVEIYDEEFDAVASSPRLSERRWKVPQALRRGADYYWQVKAIKDGKETIAPQPPAPQVKFRVLEGSKANELWRARQTYGSSHLVMGLLYVEAGLLDEAEAEFRALAKANPESTIAQQLLKRVRAQKKA